jgi:hypothetical protein
MKVTQHPSIQPGRSIDLEKFIHEGLAESLHLKFMQIETAFQENQLQMLKINDNFSKLQSILGKE